MMDQMRGHAWTPQSGTILRRLRGMSSTRSSHQDTSSDVNEKVYMEAALMLDWIRIVYNQQPGAL